MRICYCLLITCNRVDQGEECVNFELVVLLQILKYVPLWPLQFYVSKWFLITYLLSTLWVHSGQWCNESHKSIDSEGTLSSSSEASLLEYKHFLDLVCYTYYTVCSYWLCLWCSHTSCNNFFLFTFTAIVLAEDAIKSALKDYKMKREKSAGAKPLTPAANAERSTAWMVGVRSSLERVHLRTLADRWLVQYSR